ncbi:MAG: DNA-directed RNA polymerase subunit beta, partial [Thermodesulfobacteriales bacterium]
EAGVDMYSLLKFQKSNQSTCWNQIPIVKKGQVVRSGQVIADGPSTDQGELALGQNILVAFMPWGGYNFEDAILMSEKLVKEDRFTSIHVEEVECIARETKLGREEITRDIPNVSEDALSNLDESGIIRVGAEVKPGDIIVGKISPKGETQLSPEERLLRAIFGDKAGDVKDTSLRASPGVYGTVIDVKMLISRVVDKDDRAKSIEDFEVTRLEQDRDDEIKILKDDALERIKPLIVNKTSAAKLTVSRKTVLKQGDNIAEEILPGIPFEKLADISIEKGNNVEAEIKRIIERTLEQIDLTNVIYDQRISKLTKPDELPPGVLKVVKVNIAVKRKLQVGDKMAGRHGNKGVISKILAEEDMPYLPNGSPVEMVLNPLGVPSRMNVGQVLETHLGWAAKELGQKLNEIMEREYSPKALRDKLKDIYDTAETKKLVDNMDDDEVVEIAKRLSRGIPVKSPVFDGASEKEIKELLRETGLPEEGKTILFDGHTGEPFDQKVTVGVMYMLKLHHLVEEKIHARAIGPYSLVTQQPLGGKAHFGGQRLGEMEVWALEAYGAAYTLQEFLTVKSDDVIGRTRIFDSIVKGNLNFEPGLPESFKVLQKELQALSLDVDLLEEKDVNRD